MSHLTEDQQVVAESIEYLFVPISAFGDGLPIDPTGDAVSIALVPFGTKPAPVDFSAAAWVTVAGEHRVKFLYGAAPVGSRTPGIYKAWAKITQSPEAPILPASNYVNVI